jgi:hypothetical protein
MSDLIRWEHQMSKLPATYLIIRNSVGWEALYRGESLGTFPTRSLALYELQGKMYENM